MKKNISIIILFTFLLMTFQNFSYAMIAFPMFNISADLGEIVETFDGTAAEKVICIEDLHCAPAVQGNISKIIQTVKNTYGNKFQFIGVEGSVGEINVNVFAKIPDKEIKAQVVNKYLKQGYLSGAELYAINYDPNMKIYGVEDDKLYQENFLAFYKSLEIHKKWQKLHAKINQDISDLQKILTINSLEAFGQKKVQFDNKKISLDDYLLYLVAQNKADISMNYPNISTYLEMMKIQKKMDKFLVDKERKLMAANIVKYLNQEEKTQLNQNDQYLYFLIKKYQIMLGKTYEQLNLSFLYEDYDQDLDKIVFFEEIEDLQDKVQLKITENRAQLQKLVKFKKYVDDMDDYFENRASNRKVEDYKAEEENRYAEMSEFANFLSRKNVFEEFKPLLQYVAFNMDDFYKIADKRNEAILDNLFKNSENSPVKVVVFGGYHTSGISQFLRSKGISYEIIRPRVNQSYDKKLYFNRVEEQYLKSVKDNININIEANALMVISALEDPAFNQKVFEDVLRGVFEEHKNSIEYLVKFINDYLKATDREISEGLIWQGLVDGKMIVVHALYGEIHIEERRVDAVAADVRAALPTAQRIINIGELPTAQLTAAHFQGVNEYVNEFLYSEGGAAGLNTLNITNAYLIGDDLKSARIVLVFLSVDGEREHKITLPLPTEVRSSEDLVQKLNSGRLRKKLLGKAKAKVDDFKIRFNDPPVGYAAYSLNGEYQTFFNGLKAVILSPILEGQLVQVTSEHTFEMPLLENTVLKVNTEPASFFKRICAKDDVNFRPVAREDGSFKIIRENGKLLIKGETEVEDYVAKFSDILKDGITEIFNTFVVDTSSIWDRIINFVAVTILGIPEIVFFVIKKLWDKLIEFLQDPYGKKYKKIIKVYQVISDVDSVSNMEEIANLSRTIPESAFDYLVSDDQKNLSFRNKIFKFFVYHQGNSFFDFFMNRWPFNATMVDQANQVKARYKVFYSKLDAQVHIQQPEIVEQVVATAEVVASKVKTWSFRLRDYFTPLKSKFQALEAEFPEVLQDAVNMLNHTLEDLERLNRRSDEFEFEEGYAEFSKLITAFENDANAQLATIFARTNTMVTLASKLGGRQGLDAAEYQKSLTLLKSRIAGISDLFGEVRETGIRMKLAVLEHKEDPLLTVEHDRLVALLAQKPADPYGNMKNNVAFQEELLEMHKDALVLLLDLPRLHIENFDADEVGRLYSSLAKQVFILADKDRFDPNEWMALAFEFQNVARIIQNNISVLENPEAVALLKIFQVKFNNIFDKYLGFPERIGQPVPDAKAKLEGENEILRRFQVLQEQLFDQISRAPKNSETENIKNLLLRTVVSLREDQMLELQGLIKKDSPFYAQFLEFMDLFYDLNFADKNRQTLLSFASETLGLDVFNIVVSLSGTIYLDISRDQKLTSKKQGMKRIRLPNPAVFGDSEYVPKGQFLTNRLDSKSFRKMEHYTEVYQSILDKAGFLRRVPEKQIAVIAPEEIMPEIIFVPVDVVAVNKYEAVMNVTKADELFLYNVADFAAGRVEIVGGYLQITETAPHEFSIQKFQKSKLVATKKVKIFTAEDDFNENFLEFLLKVKRDKVLYQEIQKIDGMDEYVQVVEDLKNSRVPSGKFLQQVFKYDRDRERMVEKIFAVSKALKGDENFFDPMQIKKTIKFLKDRQKSGEGLIELGKKLISWFEMNRDDFQEELLEKLSAMPGFDDSRKWIETVVEMEGKKLFFTAIYNSFVYLPTSFDVTTILDETEVEETTTLQGNLVLKLRYLFLQEMGLNTCFKIDHEKGDVLVNDEGLKSQFLIVKANREELREKFKTIIQEEVSSFIPEDLLDVITKGLLFDSGIGDLVYQDNADDFVTTATAFMNGLLKEDFLIKQLKPDAFGQNIQKIVKAEQEKVADKLIKYRNNPEIVEIVQANFDRIMPKEKIVVKRVTFTRDGKLASIVIDNKAGTEEKEIYLDHSYQALKKTGIGKKTRIQKHLEKYGMSPEAFFEPINVEISMFLERTANAKLHLLQTLAEIQSAEFETKLPLLKSLLQQLPEPIIEKQVTRRKFIELRRSKSFIEFEDDMTKLVAPIYHAEGDLDAETSAIIMSLVGIITTLKKAGVDVRDFKTIVAKAIFAPNKDDIYLAESIVEIMSENFSSVFYSTVQTLSNVKEVIAAFLGPLLTTITMPLLRGNSFNDSPLKREIKAIMARKLDGNYDVVISNDYSEKCEWISSKDENGKLTIGMTSGMRQLLEQLSVILEEDEFKQLLSEMVDHEIIEQQYLRTKTPQEAHDLALAEAGDMQRIFNSNIGTMFELMQIEKGDLSSLAKKAAIMQNFDGIVKMVSELRGVEPRDINFSQILNLFPKAKNVYTRVLAEDESKKTVIVSLANCQESDNIEQYLAKLNLLKDGNIKAGYDIVLMKSFTRSDYLKDINLIRELYKKSGGRIKWIYGANEILQVKSGTDAAAEALRDLSNIGAADVAYVLKNCAVMIDSQLVAGGTLLTSAGFVSKETLAAMKKTDEDSVAAVLNTVFSFMNKVYAKFPAGDFTNEKVAAEFGLDLETVSKLIDMSRFIWGETGLIAPEVSRVEYLESLTEYSWFKQVPFGLNIDLPEVVTIISRDLTREHAGLILNVFTETAEGRLYQQEIDENDEVTDTQMLTPPVLDLNALDSKEVRKMKRLVRIDRAINKVLEVTGINKLYGLLRKDKEKGTVTAEDYKNLAAAA